MRSPVTPSMRGGMTTTSARPAWDDDPNAAAALPELKPVSRTGGIAMPVLSLTDRLHMGNFQITSTMRTFETHKANVDSAKTLIRTRLEPHVEAERARCRQKHALMSVKEGRCCCCCCCRCSTIT